MKFKDLITENTEDKLFVSQLISEIFYLNSNLEITEKHHQFNRSYKELISMNLSSKYFGDKANNIYQVFLDEGSEALGIYKRITGDSGNSIRFAVLDYSTPVMDSNGNDLGAFEVDKTYWVKEYKKHIKLLEKEKEQMQKQKDSGKDILVWKPKLGKSLKVFEAKPTWMTDWTAKPRIVTVKKVQQDDLDLIKKLSKNKSIKAAEDAVKEFCQAKGRKLVTGGTWTDKDVNRYSVSYGREYEHGISYGIELNHKYGDGDDELHILMHIINIIKNKNPKLKTIQTYDFFGIQAY